MPAISVIVPFYNARAHLQRCVESVLNQSFFDFELLLINDGSDDDSLELVKTLSDSRIRIVDRPHSGVGKTRNAGVSLSSGKYLLFVDADDWIEPDMLRDLYRAAESYSAELVLFNYVMENEQTGSSQVCRLPISYPEFDKNIGKRILEVLVGPDTAGVWNGSEMLEHVWRRMYLREWFLENRILFGDEQKVMREDLSVCIKAHFFAERLVVLGGAYYHFHYRTEALGTKYRPQKMQKLQACYEEVRSFLEDQEVYDQYKERHLAWLLYYAAHVSLLNVFLPNSPQSFDRRWAEVRSILENPLVRQAARSEYLKKGGRHDSRMRMILHTHNSLLTYVYYKYLADSLRKKQGAALGPF